MIWGSTCLVGKKRDQSKVNQCKKKSYCFQLFHQASALVLIVNKNAFQYSIGEWKQTNLQKLRNTRNCIDVITKLQRKMKNFSVRSDIKKMVLTGFSRTSGLVLKNTKRIKYEDYPSGTFHVNGSDAGVNKQSILIGHETNMVHKRKHAYNVQYRMILMINMYGTGK